ncbi:MAG: DUF3987 domain-containing protein [Salinivirgaceae bacterium]|nr:DUF3987 domain-containing protein [Salinivirgaceae bacterium]
MKFNSSAWQNEPQALATDIAAQVRQVVARIEAQGIDIAPSYEEWRNVGFALADTFGEAGRDLFQRVSRFYNGYAAAETDKQFTACLQAKGHGVTIATFFALAKNAGVNISAEPQPRPTVSKPESAPEPLPLPTIRPEVVEQLPPLLRDIAHCANSPEDADILILGSIVTLSACLPNLYGVYGEREVFPNLYLFVTAEASSGKGRLSLCRRLVVPIHRQLCEASRLAWTEYNRLMQVYEHSRDKSELERLQEPPQRMLIIPANASATSVFQILNDNDGVGLIFETEGDTLAQSFKSEHGNYSDGFRKAFHHEPISYVRRKNCEHVELLQPKLSAVFSGTPRQVFTLIPDAENGLFSRFMFYCMPVKIEWLNVFDTKSSRTLDMQFDFYAQRFLNVYNYLKTCQPMRFKFSGKQSKAFNQYFTDATADYSGRYGIGFLGSVRRLGLIAFRVAMVLTALRIVNLQPKVNQLTCSDADFNTALAIVGVLLEHAAAVYVGLPKAAALGASVPCRPAIYTYLQALPNRFTRQEYVKTAEAISLPPDTAKRYITELVARGLIERVQHGVYIKRQ